MQEESRRWPKTYAGLDALLEDFLEFLWEEGLPKGTAGDCLSAVQHFAPSAKGKLPGAWRLFGTWTKVEMPRRAVPLTLLQVQAMAGEACRQRQPQLACMLLVAYHALLHTGEVLKLRPCDVVFQAGGPAGTPSAILALGLTKSGARRGEHEEIVVDDARLAKWLHLICRSRDPLEPIVGFSGPQCRVVFSRLVSQVGLATAFTPYSLRRGGATHLYEKSRNLSVLTTRGRWQSASTARLYLSEAQAEMQRLAGDHTRLMVAAACLRKALPI
jgi:integrase